MIGLGVRRRLREPRPFVVQAALLPTLIEDYWRDLDGSPFRLVADPLDEPIYRAIEVDGIVTVSIGYRTAFFAADEPVRLHRRAA